MNTKRRSTGDARREDPRHRQSLENGKARDDDEPEGLEDNVVDAPGADKRVAEIEDELRLAAGLTALREQAGLSQRELAKRIGVSQPRVAAIEQSRDVTIDVLDHYITAVAGQLEVTVIKGNRKIPLLTAKRAAKPARQGPTTKTG